MAKEVKTIFVSDGKDEFAEATKIITGQEPEVSEEVAVAVAEPEPEEETEEEAPIVVEEEDTLSYAGFHTMLSMFGDSEVQVDFTEKEVDVVIDKAQKFKNLIDYMYSDECTEIDMFEASVLSSTIFEQPAPTYSPKAIAQLCETSFFTNGEIGIDQIRERFPILSGHKSYSLSPSDPSIPDLSFVLYHNERYSIRVDLITSSDRYSAAHRTVVHVKSNKVSKDTVKENRVRMREDYDDVTRAGAELLMQDNKGNQATKKRDLVDVYMQEMLRSNDPALKAIEDSNVCICINIMNGENGFSIKHKTVSIADCEKELDLLFLPNEEGHLIKDVIKESKTEIIQDYFDRSNAEEVSAHQAKNKVHEDLVSMYQSHKTVVNGTVKEICDIVRDHTGDILVKKAVIHQCLGALSYMPVTEDQVITEENFRAVSILLHQSIKSQTTLSGMYRECINVVGRYLVSSGWIENLKSNVILHSDNYSIEDIITWSSENKKDQLTFRVLATMSGYSLSNRLFRMILNSIKNEDPIIEAILWSFKQNDLVPHTDVTPELNAKSEPLLVNVLGNAAGDGALRLHRISEVKEIEYEDGASTIRVAVLKRVTLPDEQAYLKPIIMVVAEGSSTYDFIDENRNCIVGYKTFRGRNYTSVIAPSVCIMLDNLGNFLRQCQSLNNVAKPSHTVENHINHNAPTRGLPISLKTPILWSNSDKSNPFCPSSQQVIPDSFIQDKDAIYNALPLISVLGGPHVGIIGKDAGSRAWSSEYLRMTRINNHPYVGSVQFCAFVAQDIQNLNYRVQQSGKRNIRGAINYGPGANTIQANAEAMSSTLVKAFWKGMRRISTKKKPFGLSPHGVAAQEIKFYQDRIEFEGQVLKASNILITPPMDLYKYANELNNAFGPNAYPQDMKFDLQELVVRGQVPPGLIRQATEYDYEERKEVLNELRLTRAIERHNQEVKIHNEKVKKYRKLVNYEKIAKIVNAYKKDCIPKIHGEVPSPLGFMFWHLRADIPKLVPVSDRDDSLRKLIGYKSILSRGLLSPDTFNSSLHNDQRNVIQGLTSAYVDYLGLDQEEADFMNSDPISEPDDLDFNTLTNKFIDRVCAPFTLTKKSDDFFKSFILPNIPNDTEVTLFTATLGSVDVTLTFKSTGERRTAKWMVNGKKLRRDEINPALKRAMCFEEQDAYDAFLADIQSVSLRARNLMTRGLELTITGTDRRKVPVLLEFVRSGRTWHLIVRNPDGTQFRRHVMNGGATKFSNMLASIERARRMGSSKEKELSVEKFMDAMSGVPTMGVDSIRRLLATGLKSINEALARSRKLLEDTARMVGAEWIEYSHGTKTMQGYKVTGMSGSTYLIACDKVTTSVKDRHGSTKLGGVYSLPNLGYVCIVDKSNDQMGYDIVVNRLLALKNDSFVAGSVKTLGRYTEE